MNEREALLDALRDPLPPDVGWWPPAPGWWLLGTLLLSLLFAPALLRAWRRRQARRRAERAADRWVREARTRLTAMRAMAEAGETRAVLSEASVLARRTLLAVRSRREIAALHGERWLRALDAASGGTLFTRGPGRLLESAPYRADVPADAAELGALLDALDRLIERTATATRAAPPLEAPSDAPAALALGKSGNATATRAVRP